MSWKDQSRVEAIAMPIYGKTYRFTQDNVDNAPDEPGVYGLYDGDELIYIGHAAGGATTIRSRLRDHLSGRAGLGTQNATHYRREITSSGKARATMLLDEYATYRGKLPPGNEQTRR